MHNAKKLLAAQKNSSRAGSSLPTMCNSWSILCNFCAIGCKLLPTKATCIYPRKMFFRIARSLPKTNVLTKKSYAQTADRHNSAQSCTMAGTMPINCFKQKQTACNPETWFSPLCTQCQKPLCTSKNPLPTFSAKKKDKSFRQNLG